MIFDAIIGACCWTILDPWFITIGWDCVWTLWTWLTWAGWTNAIWFAGLNPTGPCLIICWIGALTIDYCTDETAIGVTMLLRTTGFVCCWTCVGTFNEFETTLLKLATDDLWTTGALTTDELIIVCVTGCWTTVVVTGGGTNVRFVWATLLVGGKNTVFTLEVVKAGVWTLFTVL
jgi:hypothetical protein